MKRPWLTAAFLFSALPALAVAQGQPRKITVRATGEVIAPADELRLPLELATSGDVFEKVKARNDQLLERLLDLTDAHELPRPTVESTTASFDFSSSESQRDIPYGKGNQQSNRSKVNDDPFRGAVSHDPANPPLRVVRHLTLRFENLSQATEALSELTGMEAVRLSREVRLSPLQAGLKDAIPQQRKARRLAVQRARERAAELAEEGGLELRAPVSIEEVRSDAGSPSFMPPSDDPFGASVPRSRPFSQVPEANGPGDGAAESQVTVSVGVMIVFEAWQPE